VGFFDRVIEDLFSFEVIELSFTMSCWNEENVVEGWEKVPVYIDESPPLTSPQATTMF
jgi:hypothetical protein